MTAQEFLQKRFDIQNEQNAKFAEAGRAFLKANCPFNIGEVVDVGGRRLHIQHIEPLTWFEFVMIRLYGVYVDTNEVEQNGVTLSDQIKLSENQNIEPCQDN